MNIKYHLACGIALDFAFGTRGVMTLFSVLPDSPLVVNEIRMLVKREKFFAHRVPSGVVTAYFITHSLYALALVWFAMGWRVAIAYVLHIVTDWFTHTGRFAAKPFFPLWNYRIKFGREILK